jgi:hypothetical protein
MLPAVTEKERREMWLNFLHHCELGSVVLAADLTIWQKRGKYMWQTVGRPGEYSAESIASPVRLLLEGAG